MKFSEYIPLAKKTLNDKGKDINLEHSLIGLTTESIETFQVVVDTPNNYSKVLDELGDVLWYLAIAFDALEIDGDEISTNQAQKFPRAEEIAINLITSSGDALESYKKHKFHEKPLNKERITNDLIDVLKHCTNLASKSESSLQHAMSLNVEKLSARYRKGKFSSDLAKDS